MKRAEAIVMKSLLVLLPAMSCLLLAGVYDQYLTATEVERQTGLRGVTVKEEGALVHYYRRDGREILRLRFEDAAAFKGYVKDTKHFRPLLPPIGLESICGVPQMPYMIVFLTKKQAVTVQTFPESGVKTFIAFPKLQSIARLVHSRLPN